MQSKAEHKVGDRIHAKLYLSDDRASLVFIGNVIASRLHKGSLFSDRVLYDIELEQTDAPPIVITNLATGFIMPGGDEVFDKDTGAYIGEQTENHSQVDALREARFHIDRALTILDNAQRDEQFDERIGHSFEKIELAHKDLESAELELREKETAIG